MKQSSYSFKEFSDSELNILYIAINFLELHINGNEIPPSKLTKDMVKKNNKIIGNLWKEIVSELDERHEDKHFKNKKP